jgi:hypothetical protein
VRSLKGWAGPLVLITLVAGCSGSSIDSSCDVDGITQEIEHMVGESQLELTSLDSLRCSGSWAWARASVSGSGMASEESGFLFAQTEAGWSLKSPEIACGADPGLATVPEELKADACAGAG